jgi:hypothetical protein
MSPKAKTVAKPMMKATVDNSLLQCGINNNFPAWRVSIEPEPKKLVGFLANLLNAGIEWTIPPVTGADWMPVKAADEDGAEPVPVTAAALARLREQAVAVRNKEVKIFNEKKPIFFAFLSQHLSPDSAVLLTSHADYEEAHRLNDPTMLWNIIIYTHLIHVNGASVEHAEVIRDDHLSTFTAMSQTNRESIGAFLTRLKDGYTVLIAAGIPEYIEAQKAIQFLKKLDPHRHGAMYADMINRSRRGEQLPQSLFEAYTIASNYLVKRSQSGYSQEDHSIYNVNANRGGGRGQGRGRGRDGTPNRRSEPRSETRNCYNCDAIGHIQRNCPNPRRDADETVAVTTAVTNDDPFDDNDSVISGGYAFTLTSRQIEDYKNSPNRLYQRGYSRRIAERNGVTVPDVSIVALVALCTYNRTYSLPARTVFLQHHTIPHL